MTALPTLSNPPILEALGQINFQINDTAFDLDAWLNTLQPETIDDIFEVQVPATGEPIKLKIGKRITTNSNKNVIQISNHFLSISQVAAA